MADSDAEYDDFTALLFDSAQGHLDRSEVTLIVDESNGVVRAVKFYDPNEGGQGVKERLGNFDLATVFKQMTSNVGFRVQTDI